MLWSCGQQLWHSGCKPSVQSLSKFVQDILGSLLQLRQHNFIAVGKARTACLCLPALLLQIEGIYVFVSTVPVLLDTCFKYWIFVGKQGRIPSGKAGFQVF